VTLTGNVSTYSEKFDAARAAERVYGVKAVANDLTVKPIGAPRDDSDIARAIAHILEWNVQVPEGRVHARVQNGWITLDGEVDYDYQRHEVERMVRNVSGVVGVTDLITVRPRHVTPPPPQPGGDPGRGRGKLQARGRGRRPAHQGRGLRPHRQAVRSRALPARGQRRPGGGGRRARSRRRRRPPRRHPVAGTGKEVK
jgi:hypothetical protein